VDLGRQDGRDIPMHRTALALTLGLFVASRRDSWE
jgi:hypothetical protein